MKFSCTLLFSLKMVIPSISWGILLAVCFCWNIFDGLSLQAVSLYTVQACRLFFPCIISWILDFFFLLQDSKNLSLGLHLFVWSIGDLHFHSTFDRLDFCPLMLLKSQSLLFLVNIDLYQLPYITPELYHLDLLRSPLSFVDNIFLFVPRSSLNNIAVFWNYKYF